MKDVIEEFEAYVADAEEYGQGAVLVSVKDLKALLSYTKQCEEALGYSGSWLERWAEHVGSCLGGRACTCGLTRIRFDVARALSLIQQGE